MEEQREKKKSPHCYSFIQRATLQAQFTELNAPVAPVKYQVADESGIDKTKGKAPNSESASQRTDQVSHLRCHFPELKSQLALVRYPELPRSPGNHRPNDELKETEKREKEEAPHYYSFIQRATLHARFTELNALVAPVKSQVANESGIDKTEQREEEEVPHYFSFIQTATLVAPLKSQVAKTQQGQAPLGSDTAAAQQQHGGVGHGSRFLQILGFCKPTDSLVDETPKLLGGMGPGSRFLQNIGYLEPTGSREGKTAEDERPSSSEPTPIGPAGGPRTEENLPSNEAGVHKALYGRLLDVVGDLKSITEAMNNRLLHIEKEVGIHEDVVGELRSTIETMNNRLIHIEEVARIHEVNPRGMHEETSSAMQPQLDRSVSFSDWLPENRVTGLNEATQERVRQRSFAFHRIDFKLNLEQEAPEGSDPAPPQNDSSQQQPGPSGLMKAPKGSDPSPNDSLQENY